MVAYLNPNQHGFNYNFGANIKTQITKEEARDNLMAIYTAFFLNDNQKLLILLKNFIENPDEERFFLILNELRKELGNNSLEAASIKDLLVKIRK